MDFGFATSITSLDKVNLALEAMDDYDCDTIRLAMTNTNIQRGTRPFSPAIIQQVLDNSPYTVISDPNHTYPPGSIGWNDYDEVLSRCMELIDDFASYEDRFLLEPVNEMTISTHQQFFQDLINDLRAYGYVGWLVYNLLPGQGPQQPLTLNDPLNKTAGGFHNYFNTASVNYAMDWVNRFLSRNILCVATEIGSNWNEYREFTSTNVQKVVDFSQQAYDLGLHNSGHSAAVILVWLNKDIENLR
jgi:hypothetical protein